MSKKQLDTTSIVNELSGQSAFFKPEEKAKPSPPPQRPESPAENERKTVRDNERADDRTKQRSENRSVALPVKRETKRYSFEFYTDQLVKLKQLKIKTELDGQALSLSEMVRVAVDIFLKDK